MDGTVETVVAQSAADISMPQSPQFETSSDDDEQHQPDTKERHTASGTPITIGATQVNERANMLYTRQYRGRNRLSQRQRIRAERARREEAEERGTIANNNEDVESNQPSTSDRRRSSISQIVSNYFGRASVRSADNNSDGVVVSAILVEEADVVVATEMGCCEQNWKKIAVVMTTLLVILATLLSLFIVGYSKEKKHQQPEPTASPTFDSKPTLQTVQERGFIRCGFYFYNNQINTSGSFHLNLCRAVASVVVGDADSYEIIQLTLGTRWSMLNTRNVDLLVGADTYTIEREVRLASAESGFTFSVPYHHAGMKYAGDETFIECAENKKRYGICGSLSICVHADSTPLEYVASNFPKAFYTTTSSADETVIMMDNGTCNVVATELSLIFGSTHHVGDKQFTKEPHAFVTRNTDREFSDVVNWVLQALFYGEEQDLTKNATLCGNSTNVTSVASELNYLNAVYCVGSYKDLYQFPGRRGINGINNGTKMHYPIPFGDLDYAADVETQDWENFGPRPNSTFSDIIIDGKLNCGVVVQADNDTESVGIVGMSKDYCRTMAAAFFYGNYEAVELLNFSSTDEAFLALQNGTIDVLAGTIVEKFRDFGGYQFSTPYYYKSGTVKEALVAFALATREDDSLFSSFVNCVILATLYAEERGRNQVPFASIFGSEMRWSLRDAVSYSKSYDKLFTKHFGIDSVKGRNGLNRIIGAGPQHHSLPSLT